MSVTITVRDHETGEEEAQHVRDGDSFVLTTEPAYVSRVQTFRNGTQVVTIKGRLLP